jgi:TatD DNase family protein
VSGPNLFVVDSHCHLDYPGLAERLDQVLERAEEAGVRLLVSIGTRVRKIDSILEIAERYPQVWCTVGTHPHHAAEEPDVTADELVRLARHPKVVGIGEAGLDYHYDFSPRDAQAAGFRVHIEAARRSGLPLVIHSREAEADTAAILEEEIGKGPFKPLLHCYTSGADLARRGLALGAYVSFSGILTYKSAEDLRNVARSIPLNRLLVETDAPYLAPVPHRGETNEPAFVVRTLEALAALRQTPITAMAEATSRNFFELFSKVARPEPFASAA